MKFEKNPYGPNEVLDGEGFYISFNLSPWMGFSVFESDNGGSETALVNPNDKENKFRILNGDFRKDYEKIAHLGFEECLKFYESKKEEHDSSWSTNR